MANPLNILIQNRPDTPLHPGGDTVQMEKSAQFLRDAGHRVELSFDLEPDLSSFDVVHLFNLTRPTETAIQAKNARRQGKPCVLSSVYWDLESAVPWSAYESPRKWIRLAVPDAIRSRVRRWRGRDDGATQNQSFNANGPSCDAASLQREILAHARMVFPNSDAERRHILERFPGIAPEKFVVVMNGIDPPESADLPTPSAIDGAIGAFICAGAIGPRKNQLNLVRAFRGSPDERLIIIGRPSPGSERYSAAVRRAAGPNVSFHDPVPHDTLAPMLRTAKAVVQPSYIETPGLSAMEGLALGTPIVVADVAPVREYFGDAAQYCNPASPKSIASACKHAATSRRPNGDEFARRFAWEIVLEPYRAAYEKMAAEQ